MANDDDLAGTSAANKNAPPVRELHPITFDRKDRPGVKDFRPKPVVEDPTPPPVMVLPEEPIHPSTLPAAD
jgi:hypothetical protein